MAIPTREQFRQLALADDGEPVSAGGPPFRDLTGICLDAAREERDRRFLAAAEFEAGQLVPTGGPPLRVLDKAEKTPTCGSDLECTCRDCGASFTFTEGQQEFYAAHGLSAPLRCPACRAARKTARMTRREPNVVLRNFRTNDPMLRHLPSFATWEPSGTAHTLTV